MRKFKTREAAVTSDGERRRAALAGERSDGAADVPHDRRRERAADDPADVVDAENFRREVHARRKWRSRCGSQSCRPGNGPPRKPTWPPLRGNSSIVLCEVFRVAASKSCSGRKGSSRWLSKNSGTRIPSRYV